MIQRKGSLIRGVFTFAILGSVGFGSVFAQKSSRSFELRYFTQDAKANGETDFKGETEYFDTIKRIEYLNRYEKVAGEFFENRNWDQLVIDDQEAREIAAGIKPQPLPVVRKRLVLDEWKMMGYKSGKREAELSHADWWNQQEGVLIEAGQLLFTERSTVTRMIEPQEWRSLISLEIKPATSSGQQFVSLGDALKVSFKKGGVFVQIQGKSTSVASYEAGNSVLLKIETDLESGKYNLYVDGSKVVDFQSLDQTAAYDRIILAGSKGCMVDKLYGVKYTKAIFTEDRNSRDIPFYIHTFLDENFNISPPLTGWQEISYEDEQWETVSLPFAHGGDRYQKESMYLRKEIFVSEFSRATLNFETIDPGGEIWINGEVVSLVKDRTPYQMDISEHLEQNSENTIAVRVFPNEISHTNRHSAADRYTGWFAGRSWIDLHQDQYIKDLFVHTTDLGKDATVSVEVSLQNDEWGEEQREVKIFQAFEGYLKVQFFKWFPEEEEEAAFQERIPVSLRLGREEYLQHTIHLESPDKWHFESPNLYKVVATIEDEQGHPIDDFIITTGIRTVGQEGGTFRINGNPEMMNGALLFGYKYPLEDISRTLRCADDYWLVKEVMMMKRGNGNTLRMSIHHGMKGGINDPRLAEIGDQLGIMFQWTTGTWIRTGSPWLLDFDALSEYVRQVRNHPSIVMWQPGNHPRFRNFQEDATSWFKRVYEAIYPNDPSRLISPAANSSRFLEKGAPNDMGTLIGKNESFEADPVWTAPMITRGNMDHTTGYGAEWSTLRKYPHPPSFVGEMGWREKGFRTDYLDSPHRAYFDYESEESAGQPNWTLRKGKPSYRIRSYELNYDVGSIGRNLSPDEWRTSQAWQGFSAFEAYKKKRWLDYDGMTWCPLHGGGNTSTYQKPMIDYFGYSKISFHTVSMAFQDLLACSKNVDVVYGPDDTLPIVVINSGEEKKVDLTVICRDLENKEVFKKEFSGLSLEAGRSVLDVDDIDIPLRKEGYYIFEYNINQIEK